MRLLSKELVSLEYREQLQRDLAKATVCRFLVAYISGEGIESISRPLLTRALRDPRSFGVGSLSCSCGFEPLLRLQQELGDSVGLRLKYFMDPLVNDPGEPQGVALFHSKLVYLAQEREGKSVIYLGSHNWTRRALGPGGPRNVEASVRLEMELVPQHLEGTDPSLASQVNRHLLLAYNLPACLPATASNEATFKQWYDKGCRRASPVSLEEVAVVLAVRKLDGATVSPLQWQALTGRGIYLQALEEGEGQTLWRSTDRILVLVWSSVNDLRSGSQPVLLCCRITTSKAGPNSRLHGTTQSTAPVAGFEAVLFDETQLAAMQQSSGAARSTVPIWSGRNVEKFDFEFPTPRSDSSQVDGAVTPRYQSHLEVEHVVFPMDGERPEEPQLVWSRESFAVAKSRESARYEAIPGYRVRPDEEAAILKCLTQTLLIDPEKAKVLPVTDFDEPKVGKHVSAHPLHETFLGRDPKRTRFTFYQKAEQGTLVADLDEADSSQEREGSAALFKETIPRVQRVFTTPWNKLEELWAATAKQFRSRRNL
jgi:hypothetical protein